MLMCVVQVDASQGRRGRDTGSYVDRGERREAPHGRRTSVADSRRRTLPPGPDRRGQLQGHGKPLEVLLSRQLYCPQ